jgi:tetratricopeptide (TPR) repeat protein
MFNKALANDSTFAKAYLGLAWVFWNEHYYETLGSKMFLDSVLILSNLAIKFDNQLSEAYTARGDYYKEIREPVQALEEYDKAIKLNPNSWQAYLEKGWLLWDYDVLKCIENLQIAISLNHGPEMAGVFQAMGIIYGSVGFFDKTAYYYNEAFKQGKDTLQYYKNQRWLAGDLKGDYAKAVEFDKKILAIDSINLWNYYQFMCDYMHDRQSGPAFRYLKEYMKRKTGSPSDEDYFGLYAFAWVYLQNGNKKEAIRLLNLQIEKLTRILEFGNYTGLFRVYHDLACAYALLGENKKTYDNLRLFLKEEGIWDMYFLNLIKHNPPFDAIRNQTEFRQIVEELESRQQKEHERVRKWLEEKGML